ncbi:hypothetical protein ACI2I2_20760 [Scandinavium sp. NPDC088450]|uniref:hypothetical protein n=1 Tax=Scandinavium sp. NPDC088450 TaxID=3364514 RepID=UPI00384C802E
MEFSQPNGCPASVIIDFTRINFGPTQKRCSTSILCRHMIAFQVSTPGCGIDRNGITLRGSLSGEKAVSGPFGRYRGFAVEIASMLQKKARFSFHLTGPSLY